MASSEAETGQATGWHGVGSLRLASSAARWQELKRSATMAKGFGFHVDLVSPRRRASSFRCSISNGVVGAAWIEGDGYVDPGEPDQGLRGRRARGRRALDRRACASPASRAAAGASLRVVTDGGEIATEMRDQRSRACGVREIAAMVGTRVPACAVEHQYFVTEKIGPDSRPGCRRCATPTATST